MKIEIQNKMRFERRLDKNLTEGVVATTAPPTKERVKLLLRSFFETSKGLFTQGGFHRAV